MIITEHVVTEGPLIPCVKRLKIDDREIFIAQTLGSNVESRKSLIANSVDTGLTFIRTKANTIPQPLDAGPLIRNPERLHILMPLVAADCLRCSEQSDAAAQNLFIFDQTFFDAVSYFLGAAFEPISRSPFNVGIGNSPAQTCDDQ